MVKFEIFSDPICPWCYIAKKWLDRALEAYPEHNFNIEWKPFQLNPYMPVEGMARQDYLDKKFGSRQQAIEAYKLIVETLVKNKINIDFAAIEKTPNTLNAHRLIFWAGIEGVQTRVVSGLFNAYFRDGKDIGCHDVLVEIASKHGLRRELIEKLLSSNEDREHVKNIDTKARQSGIKGVPMFIIDHTYAVSGAQPTQFWMEVFSEIMENQEFVSSKTN
ncbi:MAG: DsbA family oxidoreductase [Pseudomonadota bacterium]|nr:DsbA family oxidoreductase [Pseudomonadota bacterium]